MDGCSSTWHQCKKKELVATCSLEALSHTDLGMILAEYGPLSEEHDRSIGMDVLQRKAENLHVEEAKTPLHL